ncbi:uncharacterized protein LOC107017556 [Solanum pennellii]|uniref:Uncharacterized protein LOC107017556 n=1 Tax=Solanum pennellii TaxID=28526 RepID=A0ABM1GMC6_SOLPN|nr:uncharacterized protein LOC107017556 [Solanum pennellii]
MASSSTEIDSVWSSLFHSPISELRGSNSKTDAFSSEESSSGQQLQDYNNNNLLALYRNATIHHNKFIQETLLNLLLRNDLHYNLYNQVEKFVQKPIILKLFLTNR